MSDFYKLETRAARERRQRDERMTPELRAELHRFVDALRAFLGFEPLDQTFARSRRRPA